jgi:hypothetical protein
VSNAVCPVCYAKQVDSLLCDSCTDQLRTDLRGNRVVMGVAELVDNLHVAQAKLARVGGGSAGESRKGDTKHERLPIHIGAMDAVRRLDYYLASWARDLTGDEWRPSGVGRVVRREGSPPGPYCLVCDHPSCMVRREYQFTPNRYVAVQAAGVLLDRMDDIRKHGAVKDIIEEIGKALAKAKGELDAPDYRRFPIGPCPEECDRTVFALCPAEGSQRPALMACYLIVEGENRPDLGAGFAHNWTSIQFYRVGERIRRKMEQDNNERRSA